MYTIPPEGGFHIPKTDTPIGCRGIYDTNVRTCDIPVKLANGPDCTGSSEANPHPLCGVTLTGLTVAGLEYYRSWQNASYFIFYNYSYNYSTSFYSQILAGVKILIDNSEGNNLSDIYRVQFDPVSAPGTLWDGYMVPDQKVTSFCPFVII